MIAALYGTLLFLTQYFSPFFPFVFRCRFSILGHELSFLIIPCLPYSNEFYDGKMVAHLEGAQSIA